MAGIRLRCPWYSPLHFPWDWKPWSKWVEEGCLELNKLSSLEQKSLIPPLFAYSLGTYYVRETSVHCCTDSQLPPVTRPQCQLPLRLPVSSIREGRPLLRNTGPPGPPPLCLIHTPSSSSTPTSLPHIPVSRGQRKRIQIWKGDHLRNSGVEGGTGPP